MSVSDATDSILDVAVVGLAVGVASKTFSLFKDTSKKVKPVKWF